MKAIFFFYVVMCVPRSTLLLSFLSSPKRKQKFKRGLNKTDKQSSTITEDSFIGLVNIDFTVDLRKDSDSEGR